MGIFKSRLFIKILLSYVALLLVFLLIVDYFVSQRAHGNYTAEERKRLESVAQVLAASLPSSQEMRVLQPWAAENGKIASVRVTVVDGAGKVLADNQSDPAAMNNHSNRPEIIDAFQSGSGSSIRYSRTLGKNELYFACRVAKPGWQGIVLRLAIPLQDISEGFRPTQRELVLISCFPFLLAAILGYLFARSLTKRVAEIRNFSADMAQGNLSARVHITSNDELGSLASSLNATADAMQQYVRELQEEKNRSQAILEGMQAGVLATNAEGRITLINPALLKILELKGADYLGKRVLEIIRNAELKGILDRALMGQKEVTATIEITLSTKRTFAVVVVPLFHPNSTLSGVVAVLHDISRIVELENIRKDFVANLSHELRTPLTSIRGFAETLLDGALADRKNNRRFVEIIKNHANRLTDLTNDLLTLASLESEKIRLKLEPVEWGVLMEEVKEEAKPLWTPRRQQISIEATQDLPASQGDRERLRHVLVNLLDNAIKFTSEEGKISLRAALAADQAAVEVHVTDNGPGIPSQDLPRIFERFYRVDKARSRELGGTGLGLSIVKHLVELHRGKVGVTSQLGEGSDFYFVIPL